jgi:hypothetical protein
LITLGLFFSLSAHAITELPAGSYKGGGRWRDQEGATGKYETIAVVTKNQIVTKYQFKEGTRTLEMTLDLDQKGFFPVKVAGHVVGSGYCLSKQCHYSLTYGSTKVEETLTFHEGNFYRLGSKQEGSSLNVWEEALKSE